MEAAAPARHATAGNPRGRQDHRHRPHAGHGCPQHGQRPGASSRARDAASRTRCRHARQTAARAGGTCRSSRASSSNCSRVMLRRLRCSTRGPGYPRTLIETPRGGSCGSTVQVRLEREALPADCLPHLLLRFESNGSHRHMRVAPLFLCLAARPCLIRTSPGRRSAQDPSPPAARPSPRHPGPGTR